MGEGEEEEPVGGRSFLLRIKSPAVDGSPFEAEFRPRARTAWASIERFLTRHKAQDIKDTLLDGVSDATIAKVEEKLGIKFPPSFISIYKEHNGQVLKADQNQTAAAVEGITPSLFHGLLGGYSYYNDVVSTRLLTLERGCRFTQLLRQNQTLDNEKFFVFGKVILSLNRSCRCFSKL